MNDRELNESPPIHGRRRTFRRPEPAAEPADSGIYWPGLAGVFDDDPRHDPPWESLSRVVAFILGALAVAWALAWAVGALGRWGGPGS